MSGRLSEDPEELKGVREALKIESKLGVPLEVAGRIRGVVMVASQQRGLLHRTGRALHGVGRPMDRRRGPSRRADGRDREETPSNKDVAPSPRSS
jgi:hypothetical protein